MDSGNQTLYAFSWDYDAVGNRAYQLDGTVPTYYEYDAANELTRSHELGTGWSYYSYDANGNLLQQQGPVGTTYYEYSAVNLVTAIRYPDATCNYFHYDGKLRRYALEDSDGLHYLTWDDSGLRLLAVRDAAGSLEAEYTHGHAAIPGIGTIASARVMRNSVWEERFYVINHHGDVMSVYDDSNTQLASYTYNAWRQRLHATEANNLVNWFQYQTDWMTLKDGMGDLCLSPTRLFCTCAGIFTTRDPLGYIDGMSLYAGHFAQYSVVDPTGAMSCARPDRKCCCCVDLLSATTQGFSYRSPAGNHSTGMYTYPFTFEAHMTFKPSLESSDCQFAWIESLDSSTSIYDTKAKKFLAPWVHTGFKPGQTKTNENFTSELNDHDKTCPGGTTAKVKDSPGIPFLTSQYIYTYKIQIIITVKNSPDCDCLRDVMSLQVTILLKYDASINPSQPSMKAEFEVLGLLTEK